MIELTAETASAAELRAGLVDELVAEGTIVSKDVEAAFRTVPRHLFAPGATLAEAYAQDIVVTKRDKHGVTISSVSAPRIQAMMLEQAGLMPGMRVLEIGSGGFNAALMAEIVGEGGGITTVDIDPDVIERARSCLARASYTHVNVVLADGEEGCYPNAPFDRIIVTVGAWDIPSAWVNQLAEDGTITVPLRMRGLTRSVTFARVADHLVSRSAQVCGFVAMQGSGAHQERLLLLRGKEIGLRFDEECPGEPDRLNGALDTARAETWSGVTVGRREPFDTLHLWLASALGGFCLLTVDSALDTGLVAPQNRMACPAMVDAGSFAYLALRKRSEDTFEFGAHGFGPDASTLAEVVTHQVRIWDRHHRGGSGPLISIYPVGTPSHQMPDGLVITKRHVHVVLTWSPEDISAIG